MSTHAIIPDEAFYPITELELFTRHDRASWEEETGEQAPPFDSSRRRQAWADPDAVGGSDGQVEYTYFDTATRSFSTMKMPAKEARIPNLPGDYLYSPYIIQPTAATVVDPDGGTTPVNPKMLCYRAEADALAAEIGATKVTESKLDNGQFKMSWNGENRRIWVLQIGSQYYSAALLLQRKYRNGVGYPGQWAFESDGQPIWVLHPPETGVNDSRPEIPIPCRKLDEREALYLGHPMKVVVYRTDMESEYNTGSSESGSGEVPADIRTTLERIDANVQQLLMLHLTGGD